MKKHIALWNRIWLPFCAANGVTDPTAWAPVQAANCLTEHQENYIDRTETAGDRKPQHHVYKELRAALGAIFSFYHNGVQLAETFMIKATAEGLRRDHPLRARYEDTWNPNIFFAYIYAMASHGVYIADMEHGEMRPWVAMLLKLRTGGRSADLCENKNGKGGLFRNYSPASPIVLAGLRGRRDQGTITHVRWHDNKTGRFVPGEYSGWMSLGGYVTATEASPLLACICTRRALEAYVHKTHDLPRDTDAVFISKHPSKPRDGSRVKKFSAIGNEAIANDVGAVMTQCGVPARFKPHSTRHAHISMALAMGHSTKEVAQSVRVSEKIMDHFYARPMADPLQATELAELGEQTAMMLGSRGAGRRRFPELPAPVEALRHLQNGIVSGGAASASSTVATVSMEPPPTAAFTYAVANPVQQGSEQLFEVESILSERYFEGEEQFQVRWKGWSSEHDTWEPKNNLVWATEAIEAYKAKGERAQRSRTAKRRLTEEPPAATASHPSARTRRTRQNTGQQKLAVETRSANPWRRAGAGSSFVECPLCGVNIKADTAMVSLHESLECPKRT